MKTPLNKFFKYATFNIIGMLGISCYILADTFFIANGIGAHGLAALNLAIPIYSFIHGCALMLGSGGATKFIIAKCQGEFRRANDIFTNGIKIGLLISLALLCVGLFCSQKITDFLRADAELWSMTNTYLKVILIFSPFFMVNEQLLAYVRADGNPALAMTAMVTGSIANIILDYIFIYPLQMGILGAVLATGIAPIVSMLILSRHILSKTCSFHIQQGQIEHKNVVDIIVLGFPAFVAEISAGIVMIIFNLLIMNQVGNIGVAAYGIIANVALVTTAIFTGLAQGVQPLISEAYSTSNYRLLRSYVRWSFITASALSIILYAVMYCNADSITALFNSSSDLLLQTLGINGIVLYFTSLPLTAINLILCVRFTATENPIPAHIISLLRGFFIVIPLSLWMSNRYGINGTWLTVTITEFISAVIAFLLSIKHTIGKKTAL